MKYTPNELHEIRFKKLIYKLVGISSYLMQDHENDIELSQVEKLWKSQVEIIELIMELIEHLYLRKISDIKFTKKELEIMRDLK